MFKLIKRLLIAATIILTISVPSAAYARFFEYGPPLRSSTSQQAQPAIARLSAAKLRQLDQLQPSVAQQFASEGGRRSGASAVHSTGPSSQDGFQWGDAGIGAAGVLALLGIGACAAFVIRRRARHPLTS